MINHVNERHIYNKLFAHIQKYIWIRVLQLSVRMRSLKRTLILASNQGTLWDMRDMRKRSIDWDNAQVL